MGFGKLDIQAAVAGCRSAKGIDMTAKGCAGLFLYVVTHVASGRKYVGITTKTVMRRWSAHQCHARHGSKMLLHVAIREHGSDAFDVEHIACGRDFEALKAAEMAAILQFDCMAPRGYNRTRGGQGALGLIPTAEHLEKLSKSHLGKRHTEATKRKIGTAGRGRTMPEDAKRKIAQALINRWKGEAYRRDQTDRLASFCRSERSRSLASARMAKQLADPSFAKHRDQTGRKRTPESRERMSIARKMFFVNGGDAARMPVSKLNADQVAQIRAMLRDGVLSQVKIAKQYGVATSTIWYIANRVTWPHVEAA